MDFARNIIFITSLLSGICYSNAREPGSDFFVDSAGLKKATITTPDVVRKLAEELICGDNVGWASTFPSARAPLVNPCGEGKCVVNTDMSDYDCECFTGYKFKEDYSSSDDSRTCIKSESLVTCKPGSRRVAAETLIVGKLDTYKWVSGIYERKAGLGYDNENEVSQIVGGVAGARLQQYRHDVPLKGREFYEQYKVVPNTCDYEKDEAGNKIVSATLSFNYRKNQWQFTNENRTHDLTLQVSSRDMVKCVEDVTDWSYTYRPTGPTTHLNVGMLFVNDVTDESGYGSTDTDFQVRDIEVLDSTRLNGITKEVLTFKGLGSAGVCNTTSDFMKLTQV